MSDDVDRLYKAIIEHTKDDNILGPITAHRLSERLSNTKRLGSLPGSVCAKTLARKFKGGHTYSLYLDDGLIYPKDSIMCGHNKIWDSGAIDLREAAVGLFSDVEKSAQLWRDIMARLSPNDEWFYDGYSPWPPFCTANGCYNDVTHRTMTLRETGLDVQYWCEDHLFQHLEYCQKSPHGSWQTVLEMKSIDDCKRENTIIDICAAMIRYENGGPVVVESEKPERFTWVTPTSKKTKK